MASRAARREGRRADALVCPSCRWWTYVWSKQKTIPWEYMRNEVWEASVSQFDYEIASRPLAELRSLIVQGRLDLRDVSPRELERIVTAVFRDALGRPAIHVGGSRDGGVDVLVLDGDPPLAIQVKRRSTAGSERPAVIRDLIGALAHRVQWSQR
jgi:Restriction endonuclease